MMPRATTTPPANSRETGEVRRVVLPPCFEPANGEKSKGGDQSGEQAGQDGESGVGTCHRVR